jgi:hypothetical protein
MANSKVKVKDSMPINDKAVVEEVRSSSVKMELTGPFWLTRDKRMGVLSDLVEVWLVKPDLHRFDDGDVMWLPNLEHVDTEDTHFAEWSLDKCRKEVYTVPDSERECIKVG